jgi:hypothetical protein
MMSCTYTQMKLDREVAGRALLESTFDWCMPSIGLPQLRQPPPSPPFKLEIPRLLAVFEKMGPAYRFNLDLP